MDTKQPISLKINSTNIVNATILSLVTIGVVGCGGSDSDSTVLPAFDLPPPSDEGGQLGVFNPDATFDVFACEAPYYLELRNTFEGTIGFTPSGGTTDTCTWDVELQVRGSFIDPADTSVCTIDSTYEYTLVSGDSQLCTNGSVDSLMIDPLANPVDRDVWVNTPYPIDLPTDIDANTFILDGTIVPFSSLLLANPEVVWQFSGFDTVSIVDTTEADGTVSGTLITR